MGQCLHKAPVEGRLVLVPSGGGETAPGCASSSSNVVRSYDYFSPRIQEMVRSGGGETAPGCASSSSNVVRSYDYFSPRIQEMIERRSGGEYETEVDAETKASTPHWSELSVNAKQRCAEEDKVFFRNLKHGARKRFFSEWSDSGFGWELGEKLAEGAQGAIYAVKGDSFFIIKVFKAEAGSLEDLHKQWPPSMLKQVIKNPKIWGYFSSSNVCPVLSAVLLEDGRFAFVMRRYWGDLRKMIDECMMRNGNKSAPFCKEKAFEIICGIMKGMRELHKRGIVHWDLKASNVLIRTSDWKTNIDVSLGTMLRNHFGVVVADFESSALTVGTTFWRAPEVLTTVKNHSFMPSVCTEKSDVYSFSMTCYEVLTGKLPFEGELSSDYNMVLGGNRPKLPSGTDSRIQSMLERCWQHEPSKRPSFEEIWEEFDDIMPKFGNLLE